VSSYSADKYTNCERSLLPSFSAAELHLPSLVFIDHVEALSKKTPAAMRLSSEFVSQMTAVQKMVPGSTMFVFAATSAPWDVDPVTLKSFQRMQYIGLPGHDARQRLLQQFLSDAKEDGDAFLLDAQNITELVKDTEGMSCTEISEAFTEILKLPLQQVQKATHFKQVCRSTCAAGIL
jgi:SpoVK/Ycf46/Vps4 family AAA+-type ATPase